MSSPRVFFVPNCGKFSLGNAEEFGRIVRLTGMRSNPLEPLDVMREAERQLLDYDYDTDSDFIAFTGPSVLVALLFAVALRRNGRANLLLFDARNGGKYVPKRVTLEEQGARA